MRNFLLALLAVSGLMLPSCAQTPTCSNGAMTTISGTVYAPNGKDPLPNVLVFVQVSPLAAFDASNRCEAPGTPPSGSGSVGAITAYDGTFTILNAPTGADLTLVIQTGRWRRSFPHVAIGNSCADNPVGGLNMPANQSQGNIPKFAIATGAADQVECVLLKLGIDQAEFTNPTGTGRINLYQSDGTLPNGTAANIAGARIDATTPPATQLMGSSAVLNSYDVLMLPCVGNGNVSHPADQLNNLVQFANTGGRVYSSHFSYEWMYRNAPFDTVASWNVNQITPQPDPGVGTIDQSFSDGQTLAQWLQVVHATTTQGQMPISVLKHDLDGVVAPTRSYMTLNSTNYTNPVMQMVFDTPVGQLTNQCGRVLFDEYHVENPPKTPTNSAFPAECTTGDITPQEQLLEYSLFSLTANGSAATLTQATQDFGSQYIGFPSAAQTFTWTNHSTFTSRVTLAQGSGDFAVTGRNGCDVVAAGASCTITVVFTPTALGARTGVLTVGSPGSNLTSTLTGTGLAALAIAGGSSDFGLVDVGARRTQTTLSLVNLAPGPVAVPQLSFSGTGGGSYTGASLCGGLVPAQGSCVLQLAFQPQATGALPATLTVAAPGAPLTAAVTGTGVDFSIADSPASGSVIAGYGKTFNVTTTPIAGFNAPLSLSCTTAMPGATCSVSSSSVVSGSPTTVNVAVTTTSQYTVVGYSGGTSRGWLVLVAAGSAGMLWWRRRAGVRVVLGLAVLMAGSLAVTGCSGLLPAQNPVYTPTGSYPLTVTATDGFLVHSTTYTLTVTTK